jgi:hypothetical protein
VNSIKQNTQEREGRKNKERGPKSGPKEENPSLGQKRKTQVWAKRGKPKSGPKEENPN